jgi:glycosyltransferase involved in cell wall biosynthesis
VLNQSFDDIEVLIVDDGSSDRSIPICRKFVDSRIRYIHQKNRGLAAARNSGVLHARGKYISFIDADDLWAPEKLERHLVHLESAPDIGVSYSFSALVDGNGDRVQGYQILGKNPTPLKSLVTRNPVGNGSNAVIRLSVFRGGGDRTSSGGSCQILFDEELRQAEDFELWVRIAATTRWTFGCIPWALTFYRINSEGLSSDTMRQKHYHLMALDKIKAYAPDAFARYRIRSVAYMYWYLARIHVSRKRPEEAYHAIVNALRHSPSSVFGYGLLIMGAALLLRVEPSGIYSICMQTGMYLNRRVQEQVIRHRQRKYIGQGFSSA